MPYNPICMIVGPANYFSHPGSFNHLHNFFADEQLSRAVWIYGERTIAATQTKLPPAFELPGARHTLFHGHCSGSDIRQSAAESDDGRSAVIGVDGGILFDTTKALARRLGLPFVAVPMTVATCATWTPLSVWYNDAGQALHYEIFDDASSMVLLESEIILNAPQEYLLARISDTLAKQYEAVVLVLQPETLPLTVQLGASNAQAIRDVLLNSSEQALVDQQNQQLTQSSCGVVDTIIAGGGMAGGLGDRSTRAATAHTVHNGLTVLPQAEKFLHDAKVAYGILVQGTLLGQDDVLAQLTEAYQCFHLPTTLAELEVDINDQVEIDKMITHTLRPVGSIHYLSVASAPDTLYAAFGKVESSKT